VLQSIRELTTPQEDADTTSPARAPLALTVAASDKNDRIAEFSYFGKCTFDLQQQAATSKQ